MKTVNFGEIHFSVSAFIFGKVIKTLSVVRHVYELKGESGFSSQKMANEFWIHAMMASSRLEFSLNPFRRALSWFYSNKYMQMGLP